MSTITITLPDGSQRSVPQGTPVREFASGVLPQGVMKKALAAVVDGRMVDLTFPLDRDAALKIVTADGAGRAAAVPAFDGAPARGRGHEPVSRHAVRHRSGHRRGLLLRLRRQPPVRARGPREDRSEDARAGRRRTCRTSARCGRATKPSRSSRERGEPLKVQLIEEKTAGQSDVSCYTIKDRETFVDFCVGPHVPSHRQAQGVQAARHVERLLEGRRAQPADAAHLRDRVLQGRRPEAASAPDRRSQEARPPPRRQGPRPVHVPSVGAGRGVLARQGHDALQPAGRLHARGALPGRLLGSEDAAHLQQGAVGDLRPLAALPRRTCSSSNREGERDGREGHELPRPHARLREREAAAIATCRCASTSRRRCIATRRPACSPASPACASSRRTMRTAS